MTRIRDWPRLYKKFEIWKILQKRAVSETCDAVMSVTGLNRRDWRCGFAVLVLAKFVIR